MNKYVVYTAFSKGYDILRPPPKSWRKAVDFTAFIEEKSSVAGWKREPLYPGFVDPCRNAKIHKILSHVYFPNHEYSLWMDGSITITSPFSFADLVGEYLNGCDIVVFKHRRRQCIYAEAQECIAQGKDSPETIHRQINYYRATGYPENNGLIEGCVILRRHSPAIMRLNELWYDTIMRYSRRDQLSFNYVAHTLKVKFRHWPGIYTHNPHFTYNYHTDYVPRHLRKQAAGKPGVA